MTEKSKLGLFSFSMIVIGLVIGMGIFRTATDSAKAALNPTVYFSAWIIGGLVALCGALTYAEIGSRFPVTGGYYRIFSYAYHPSLAFSINCIILISNAASLSGVALIGAGYISNVFFGGGVSDLVKASIAMAAIIIFYGVNLMGLKMSSKAQNVLMIIKIGMLLVLVASLFFPSIYADNSAVTSVTSDYSLKQYILSFGVALVAVSFTYGGYQQTINFGNEVKHPSRNIPKGIFIGIAVIILLYLIVNFAYYKVVGFELMQNRGQGQEIAAILTGKLFGQTGANIFSALLFLSVLAYVNVLLMSNPRVMFAMSEDGVLPKIFQRKSKEKEVLVVALSVFATICMVILFFSKKFEEILKFTIFLDCIGMATSAATIFVLRKKTKHLDNTGIYKMKLYPLLPVVFIAAYTFVAISIAIDDYKTALTGIAVLGAFMVIYFVTKNLFTKTSIEK
ncbi:MAG: APC family permease [Chitinophagaceae bacterium]